MITKVKIGTRDSELAIWQANFSKKKLQDLGINSEIVKIKSEGDLNQITPLYDFGVSGVFTKSLDQALLNDKIDIAVHSLKDVPINLAKGLEIPCVFQRANPYDVLVLKKRNLDFNSPLTIATSSIRRKTQWLNKYPNHNIVSLRGNVGTRMKKLKNNNWDGAIFAKAGLDRLSIDPENKTILNWMIPSAAQGTVAVASKENNLELNKILKSISCQNTFHCVDQERKFLKLMDGGCSMPISSFACIEEKKLNFKVGLTDIEGKDSITANECYAIEDTNAYKKIYNLLMSKGGKEILYKLKKSNGKN